MLLTSCRGFTGCYSILVLISALMQVEAEMARGYQASGNLLVAAWSLLIAPPNLLQVEAEMARGCQAAGDSLAAMDAYMALAAKKDRLSKVGCSWPATWMCACVHTCMHIQAHACTSQCLLYASCTAPLPCS